MPPRKRTHAQCVEKRTNDTNLLEQAAKSLVDSSHELAQLQQAHLGSSSTHAIDKTNNVIQQSMKQVDERLQALVHIQEQIASVIQDLKHI